MAFECAICGIELGTVSPKTFFCSKCYNLWQTEILAGAEWVRYLVNSEQLRRSYGTYSTDGKEHRVSFVYLADYDVGDINGKKALIPTRRGERE